MAGVWCPVCRDEFRAGFTHCPDCDVDLVPVPPAPDPAAPPRPDSPQDHVLVEFDLDDWGEDDRRALGFRLRAAAVPFEWDGPRLVVARPYQEATAALIEEVDEIRVAAATGPGDDDAEPGPLRLASPGRRYLGSVIDGFVLAVLTFPIRNLGGSFWLRVAIGTAAAALYQVIPTAVTGRTAGKVVVGTRVCRTDGRVPPGARTAVLRFLVPEIALVAWLFDQPVAGFVGLVITAAIYVPILAGDRRGLHDHAAGTVVVRVPRA